MNVYDSSYVIQLITSSASAALGIACYVLEALALRTIAKRRGIQKAWLAWLPIGRVWVLGGIHDHYKTQTRGERKSYRWILMALSVLVGVCAVSVLAMLVRAVFQLLSPGFERLVGELARSGAHTWTSYSDVDLAVGRAVEDAIAQMLLPNVIAMMCVCVVMVPLAVMLAVFYDIALYNVYQSCRPSDAALYLVLSVLFGITVPFLLFSCKDKDLGMRANSGPWQGYGQGQPWNFHEGSPYNAGQSYPGRPPYGGACYGQSYRQPYDRPPCQGPYGGQPNQLPYQRPEQGQSPQSPYGGQTGSGAPPAPREEPADGET